MENGSGRRNTGQFQKGRSGNPGGRPRQARNQTTSAFDIILDKTLSVTRDGIQRDIPVAEALQHRTYQDALAGKRLAIREVLRWIVKREQWLARKRGPAPAANIIFKPPDPDPENVDEALLLLGIACPNPARVGHKADRKQLLLESWAAKAALRRRRGARPLSKIDVDQIRRSTVDGKMLKLPEGTDQ